MPQSGPVDRILQSHTEYAQGVDFGVSCNPSPLTCTGQYTGRLQPYALYVPQESPPASGYGLTLLLHAMMDNYNEFENTRAQREFGERGGGALVLSPEGRGPDAGSIGASALDVFEAWADVVAHYPLNPDWTDITGYSEGGIGTFHLTEQFPDLFARAQSIVGADTDPLRLPSVRHVPFLMWNMATDELASPPLYLPTSATLDALGYRHELDVFTPGDHTTLAVNDEFSPAVAFLGTSTVERDPAHVDYVIDPGEDLPGQGLRADHAYWLSAMRIRDSSGASVGFYPAAIPPGSVDAVSYGFGVGDAAVSPPQVGAGTLTGGNLPALAYTRTWRDWGETPATAVQDRLDLALGNVAAITVDVQQAHLDCDVDLHVSSDGPVEVTLAGCGVTRSFG